MLEDVQKQIRQMFSGGCVFMTGAATIDALPDTSVPEVAFVGRSNVGKSSLLNALTGQTTLARTSHTPGRTQQLNFFAVPDGSIRLVDLPGYGYAKASKGAVKSWNTLIRSYLEYRPNLRHVYILIDSRHGLKDGDKEVMDLLDSMGVAYQIILTKADKVKKEDMDKVFAATEVALKKHPAAFPVPHSTSSHKGYGVDDMQTAVFKLAHPGVVIDDL